MDWVSNTQKLSWQLEDEQEKSSWLDWYNKMPWSPFTTAASGLNPSRPLAPPIPRTSTDVPIEIPTKPMGMTDFFAQEAMRKRIPLEAYTPWGPIKTALNLSFEASGRLNEWIKEVWSRPVAAMLTSPAWKAPPPEYPTVEEMGMMPPELTRGAILEKYPHWAEKPVKERERLIGMQQSQGMAIYAREHPEILGQLEQEYEKRGLPANFEKEMEKARQGYKEWEAPYGVKGGVELLAELPLYFLAGEAFAATPAGAALHSLEQRLFVHLANKYRAWMTIGKAQRTLGVSGKATETEIKTTYKKLAHKWHPDVNKSPEAEGMIRKVNQAYETVVEYNKLHGKVPKPPPIVKQPFAQRVYAEEIGGLGKPQRGLVTKGEVPLVPPAGAVPPTAEGIRFGVGDEIELVTPEGEAFRWGRVKEVTANEYVLLGTKGDTFRIPLDKPNVELYKKAIKPQAVPPTAVTPEVTKEIKIIGEDKTLLDKIKPEISGFLKEMSDSTVYIVPRGMKGYGYVGRGMADRPYDLYIGEKRGIQELNETILHEAMHQIEGGKWNTPLAKRVRGEWKSLNFEKKTPQELKELGFSDTLFMFRKSVASAIKRGEFLSEMAEEYIVRPQELEKSAKPLYDFFNKYIKARPEAAPKVTPEITPVAKVAPEVTPPKPTMPEVPPEGVVPELPLPNFQLPGLTATRPDLGVADIATEAKNRIRSVGRDIGGKIPVKPPKEPALTEFEKHPGAFNKMSTWLKGGLMRVYRVPRMLEYIDGGEPGILYNAFYGTVDNGRTAYYRDIIAAEDLLRKSFADNGLDYGKMLKSGQTVTNAAGKAFSLNLSQRILIANQSQNPEAMKHLLGMKLDAHAVLQVVSSLTPKEIAFGRALMSKMDEASGEIARVSENVLGTKFTPVEHYFRIMVNDPDIIGLPVELEPVGAGVGEPTISKGFTKPREDGFEAMKLDVVEIYLRHMMQASNFIHMQPVARDLNMLLHRPEVLNILKNSRMPLHQAENLPKTISKWLREATNLSPSTIPTALEKNLRWLRGNAVIGALGLNAVTSMIQPVSIFQAGAIGHPNSIIKGLISHLKNPKLTRELMKEFAPQIYKRVMEREIKEQMTLRGMVLGKFTVKQVMTLPLVTADRLTVSGNFRGEFDWYLSKHPDDFVGAGKHAEDIIKRSQPFFEVKDLPEFWRGGEIEKLVTVFTNQINQNFNLLMFDVLGKFMKGKISSPEAIKRFFLIFVMPALVIGAIRRSRLPETKEEATRDLRDMAITQIPIVGPMIVGAMKGFDFSPGITFEGISQAVSAGQRIAGAIKEPTEARVNAAIRQALIASGFIAGWPSNQAKRVVDAALKQADGKLDDWMEYIWGAYTREKAEAGKPATPSDWRDIKPKTITGGSTDWRNKKPTTLSR